MKAEIVFFSEYKLGGVQSFHYNLLKYDPYHQMDKTWVLVRHALDQDALPPTPFEVIEDERIINFSVNDNLYDKARKISKHLSNRPGVMVTNFLEELTAIQYFTKKPKAVYFVCHDEGYIQPAVQYEFLIDVFIAHNPFFYDVLCKKLPHRKETIFYRPYGIKRAGTARLPNYHEPLKILFLARLQKLKGIMELPLIDDALANAGIKIKWTVVGDGPEKPELMSAVADRKNFKILTLPTLEDVLEECPKHDIFILPSYKDGLPVAMLESMSAGVVPVMYKFNEGIKSIITPEYGLLAEPGDIKKLVEHISTLHNNRPLLEQMSIACYEKIVAEYDVAEKAKEYYDLFYQYEKFKRPKKLKFVRHSGWLDLPFVPAYIRNIVRSVKSYAGFNHSR